MSESSHVRVVSLVLALSAVVGGWLLLESSQHAPQHPPSDAPPIAENHAPVVARDRAMQPPVPQSRIPAPTNAVPPKNLIVTFKCEHDGRISFSDQPCANDAKTLAVTAAEAVSSPKAMDNLQKLKAQAAAMEADRHARERQFEIAAAEAAKVSAQSGNTKVRECQLIDQAIASVDATLRQPHGPQEGDFWTAKRRELTDRRFSVGC